MAPSYNFEQDIRTLTEAGQDVSKITTPAYAHRLAQAVRKAQAQGKATPTRKQARGHDRAPLTNQAKQGHRLEQLTIFQPKDRALDIPDFVNLLRKAKRPPGSKPYKLVVKGLVSKYPHSVIPSEGIPKTITINWNQAEADAWKKGKPTGGPGELIRFIEKLYPAVEWLVIYSISVAYPKEGGSDAQ